MIKLWSISRNTFLQTIRQPIYTVLILVTFGLLLLTLPMTGYTMSTDYHASDQRMLEDLGLATLRVSGLLIAAFSASGVLRREIEEKTALIVIAKPVHRSTFVLGKFFGVAAAVALAYYLCCLVFLMTVRHKVMPAAADTFDLPVLVFAGSALLATVAVTLLGNLWFGWPFTSTGVWTGAGMLSAAMLAVCLVGKHWQLIDFGAGIPDELLLELAMMLLAVVIFTALAVTASSRLGQAMTLLVCIAVFCVGSAHPMIFARWAERVPVAAVVGWLVPDFTYFYPQDDLRLDRGIPLSLVAAATAYCLLYTAGLLSVGVALFQTRELEAENASAGAPPLVGLVAWFGRAAALAAAFAALALASVPDAYAWWTLPAVAALALSAVGLWVLWGAFARGAWWSWFAGGALALAALGGGLAAGIRPDWLTGQPSADLPIAGFFVAAVAAGVLVVLSLPKTRRHVSS